MGGESHLQASVDDDPLLVDLVEGLFADAPLDVQTQLREGEAEAVAMVGTYGNAQRIDRQTRRVHREGLLDKTESRKGLRQGRVSEGEVRA